MNIDLDLSKPNHRRQADSPLKIWLIRLLAVLLPTALLILFWFAAPLYSQALQSDLEKKRKLVETLQLQAHPLQEREKELAELDYLTELDHLFSKEFFRPSAYLDVLNGCAPEKIDLQQLSYCSESAFKIRGFGKSLSEIAAYREAILQHPIVAHCEMNRISTNHDGVFDFELMVFPDREEALTDE